MAKCVSPAISTSNISTRAVGPRADIRGICIYVKRNTFLKFDTR